MRPSEIENKYHVSLLPDRRISIIGPHGSLNMTEERLALLDRNDIERMMSPEYLLFNEQPMMDDGRCEYCGKRLDGSKLNCSGCGA